MRISAYGADAEEAVEDLAEQLKAGLGEEGVVPIEEAPRGRPRSRSRPLAPAPRRRSEDPNVLLGVSASPGLGVGTVLQIRHEDIEVEENSNDRHRERRKLNDSIDRSLVQLTALEDRLASQADADKAAIFAAHREILRDPDLLDLAISGDRQGQERGLRLAARLHQLRRQARRAEERAARRARHRRARRRPAGAGGDHRAAAREGAHPEPGSILVAEDLTPSDTASLDPSKVVGFCTTAGGASSHVAILARALDIPAVAGIEPRALDIPEGTRVILDGAKGTLRQNVTEDEVERIRQRQERQAKLRADRTRARGRAGHHHATGTTSRWSPTSAAWRTRRPAMTKGAEGVGLLRSEFVFMDRRTAPTEDEQARDLHGIAEALKPGQPLVIRTLDVGGDKPLPYLPIAPEENPFLGERGHPGRAGPAGDPAHPGARDPAGGRRRRQDQRDVPDDRHHRGFPAGQGDLRRGTRRDGRHAAARRDHVSKCRPPR